MNFALVISALLIPLAHSITDWGFCPETSLQSNFQLTPYLGNWYEIVREKNIQFESGDCVSANYTLNTDNTVKVVNTEYVNGIYKSAIGNAYCSSSESGQCYVRFSSYAPYGDYEVISTDYENYSIVFSCFSIGVVNWKMAWILARSPDFDPTPYLYKLKELGIPEDELYFTLQKNCPGRLA